MHIYKGKQIDSRRITELVWALLVIGYRFRVLLLFAHLGMGRGGRHVENSTVMVLKLTDYALCRCLKGICFRLDQHSVFTFTSFECQNQAE